MAIFFRFITLCILSVFQFNTKLRNNFTLWLLQDCIKINLYLLTKYIFYIRWYFAKNFSYDSEVLCTATIYGRNNIVGMIIENGVSVNQPDGYNNYPLIEAAKSGHETVIVQLLNAGAYINQKDNQGMTALMWAGISLSSKLSTMQVLVRHKADVNLGNNFHETALYQMIGLRKEIDSAQLLIDAGADVNAKNAFGVTPLMIAAEKGSFNTVLMLLNAGANPNYVSANNNTALDMAVRGNHDNVAKLLTEWLMEKG